MPQDLSDILGLLSSRREYASFFEWIDKEGKEFGVGEELVKALNSAGSLQLSNLAPCNPDPPDLTCQNAQGHLIAIEASEIVCEEAVRLNQQGQDVHRIWQPGELRAAIAERLARKDKVTLQGGPSGWQLRQPGGEGVAPEILALHDAPVRIALAGREHQFRQVHADGYSAHWRHLLRLIVP